MLTTLLKSFDTIVVIDTTSSSIPMSLTGIFLIAIPLSSGIVCGLTINNKLIFERVMQKYSYYKKQYEKDQKSIKSFDNLHRTSLQDNVVDENEYELLFNVFTKYFNKTKIEYFC